VPLEEFDAVFTTFTCAVSELPSPIGGEVRDRVTVLEEEVWAKAPAALRATSAMGANRNRLKIMFSLSWF